MKTKLLPLLLLCLLFTACSSSSEENVTPTLATNLTTSTLSFTADATEAYEVTVTTNQASWDVVSNATWCKITKQSNKFLVSVEDNTSKEERKATITVSAPNAADVTILVIQAVVKNQGEGETTTGIQITLEDVRKNTYPQCISHVLSFYITEEESKTFTGEAGKGITWDFSKIDISKAIVYEKVVESEFEKIDCSKGIHSDKFSAATECYRGRGVAYLVTGGKETLISDIISYDYYKGNMKYGESSRYKDIMNPAVFAETYVTYTPPLTIPYPLSYGDKYTISSIKSYNGESNSNYYEQNEIDGEGTVVLPDGKKYTDVLRFKENSGEHYRYKSKAYGEIAVVSVVAASGKHILAFVYRTFP